MGQSRRSPHPARIAPIAMLAIIAGLALSASAASAQIGENLVPPLETPLPLLGSTPLPTPTPTLPLQDPVVDDTVDTVEDLLDGGNDGPPPEEEGTEPTPDPTPDPDSDGDPDPSTGTTGPSGDDDTTMPGESDAGTDDGTLSPATGGASTIADASGSYPSLAARATVAAAGRAIRLAGPLAPPLILAAISIVGLLCIGRGTDRMFKLEVLRPQSKTYRL